MAFDWYTRVEKDAKLQQGDFVYGFAVPFSLYSHRNVKKRSKTIKTEWQEADWVILTQSCDLDPDNNKGLDDILICPVFAFAKFLEDNPSYTGANARGKRKDLLQNKEVGLHALKTTNYKRYPTGPYLVNFRNARIVSLKVITEHLKSSRKKTRLRLNPPYAEAMALRFGLLFSRIGYPVEFPTEEEQSTAMSTGGRSS